MANHKLFHSKDPVPAAQQTHFITTTLFMLYRTIVVVFRLASKIANSDYQLRHVCPSVRMQQLGSHWKDFDYILNFSIFRKPAEKIKGSLKSYKNNVYFT